MINGTIADINFLKFYTESGVEIYTEKQYVITWEFKEDNTKYRKLPKGFIMADIKPSVVNPDIYVIDSATVQIGFEQNPEIFISQNEDNLQLTYMDVLDALWYNYKLENNVINKYNNTIVITINLDNSNNEAQKIQFEIPATKFFSTDFYSISKYIINGDNDDEYEDTNEYQRICIITEVDPYIDEQGVPYIWKVLAGIPYTVKDEKAVYVNPKNNELIRNQSYIFNMQTCPDTLKCGHEKELTADNIYADSDGHVVFNKEDWQEDEYNYLCCLTSSLALYFPFVRYQGQLKQEKTSTDFWASNTLIVLEETSSFDENGDEHINYEHPALNAEETNWELVFQTPEAGELRILRSFDDIELTPVLQQNDSLAVQNTVDESGAAIPITLCIGVKSQTEGVYQNFLGLYLSMADTQRYFFLGVISVKTEIVGEDERYRTLMENFGIPDPSKYPTLFAEQDYEEMLCDWAFINKKCKELMLIYQDIFPYAGTYKGLINILKFLGYDDILIKEWYNITDKNGTEKNVAFDSIDLINNKLHTLLQNVEVDYTNNQQYKKLNMISMIYHINEMIDKDRIDDQYVSHIKYDKDNNPVIARIQTYSDYMPLFDIPLTQPIYTYRNDEILSKLQSVKQWLEHYIIGVNTHITDITAEGIYFIPYKTELYNTYTGINDFSTYDYVTPKLINATSFKKSSSDITCSLSEFDNITFGDYEHTTWNMFEKTNITLNPSDYNIGKLLSGLPEKDKDTDKFKYSYTDINPDIKSLSISNTFGTPIYGDEYTFELKVIPPSASLCDYTSGDNQIIVSDNKIDFLNKEQHTVEFNSLPIIYMEDAYIRHINGDWENNIAYSINEFYHNTLQSVREELTEERKAELMSDFTSMYHVQPVDNITSGYDSYKHIVLLPDKNASLVYTADNKWRIPLFIFKNFKFGFYNKDDKDMVYYDIPKNVPFILDIISGRMSFSNKGDNKSAELHFLWSIETKTQKGCELIYTYKFPMQSVITTNNLISNIPANTKDKLKYQISNVLKEIIDNEICKDLNTDSYNKFVTDTCNLYKENCSDDGIGELFSQAFLFKETKRINPNASVYVQNEIGRYDLKEDNKYYVIEDESGNKTFETGYYNDPDVSKHWYDFLFRRKKAEIEDKFYDLIDDIYSKLLNNNTEITDTVHHIGNYRIYAKVYDRFNNIYMSEGAHQASIKAPVPTFNMIINQEYSQNDKEFCSRNTPGELLSNETLTELKENNSDIIKYHTNWPIYRINYNYQTPDELFWWNYSYAYDTPKQGNFMWFRNTLFKVGLINDNNLYLYDKNISERIFSKTNCKDVIAYIYNEKTHEIIYTDKFESGSFKLNIVNSNILSDNLSRDYMKVNLKKRALTSEYVKYEYQIEIDNDSLSLILPYKDKINSGEYGLYLVPDVSYKFNSFDNISTYIVNDYTYNQANISIPDVGIKMFDEQDVIKLTYDCKIYDKFTIEIPYNGSGAEAEHEYLMAAGYDFANPCLYILHKNGKFDEIEIDWHNDIQTYKNYIKVHPELFEDVDKIIFFQQYTEDFKLYAFLLNNKKPDISDIQSLLKYDYKNAKENNINDSDLIYSISSNLVFEDNDIVRIIFADTKGDYINHLHNEVSYRVTKAIKNTAYSHSTGYYVYYTYILNMVADTYLIEQYENNPLYDFSVTLSYPYKNFVQYIASVKKDTVDELTKTGSNDYTLIRSTGYIDTDKLFLNSYLDENFQGISYEYHPKNIQDTFVINDDNIFLKNNTDAYRYNDIPVTINYGQMLWLTPEQNDYLENIQETEWSMYTDVFDPDEVFNYAEESTSKECLFKIRNNIFCIKPKTIGSHAINMSLWDKYGNKIQKQLNGALYIRK